MKQIFDQENLKCSINKENSISFSYSMDYLLFTRPKLGSECCGFNLKKRKSFGTVQIYITLSRIKTYDKLFCAGEYKSSSIKVKDHCLWSTMNRNAHSDDTLR